MFEQSLQKKRKKFWFPKNEKSSLKIKLVFNPHLYLTEIIIHKIFRMISLFENLFFCYIKITFFLTKKNLSFFLHFRNIKNFLLTVEKKNSKAEL